MSGTITLTAAMRANLLSLQKTGASLSTTQLNLSTGNKVNSALDNPVNFFAAQSLNHRASQLSALLDGMGQGIQTIQAANQGLTTLTTLVNQLTSIANTAKSDLAKATTQNVLQSAGGPNTGINSTAVADLTDAAGGGGINSATAVTAGDTFTLQDGTNPAATFTIGSGANQAGTSLASIVNAINQTSGFQASIVYGDGVTQSSSAQTLGVPSGGIMQSGQAYLKVVSTDGKAVTAANGGTNAGTSVLAALGLTVATSNAITTGGGDAGDVTSYGDVIKQINQTVTDSNYQGNNLLAGAAGANLTVQVNELSSGAITVTKVDATASGLGITAAHNGWASSADVDIDIAKINTALATLQTQASGFANSLSLLQTRQDFTTNLINTLQNGASSLTIADKNEEGANLLALQTQQQLGIQALSLSSQANQSVLRLFA